jgi:O-methyltransferase involved in polyketide biosynthesis
LFGHVAAQAQKVLVLTEGVLVYLNREDVAALAAALHEQPAFAWWLVDITTPALLQWLGKAWGESTGGAGMKFAPDEGPAFFARYGWNAAESRSMALEARRLRREMPRAGLYRFLALLMPQDRREFFRRLDSFVVLLDRA